MISYWNENEDDEPGIRIIGRSKHSSPSSSLSSIGGEKAVENPAPHQHQTLSKPKYQSSTSPPFEKEAGRKSQFVLALLLPSQALDSFPPSRHPIKHLYVMSDPNYRTSSSIGTHPQPLPGLPKTVAEKLLK
ncbi:hypothetical protein V6N11_018763 [Hibiscus sabdariffa]|uniref:Uncharacterized protein n=2 Tax=Hibiscus sabdariffa TaxID=183260 RepID=A0ABR2QT86_9ROSI